MLREMKAAVIEEHGPPSAIRYRDWPRPRPGPGELLVRVGAVSVNPIDTYIRAGSIPMETPLPYIPGCDFAGTVEEAGAGAGRFRPGDRVWGSNQGLMGRQGTFAEWIAVDERFAYPAPGGSSDAEMAALALVAITAHLGLGRAGVERGETVFVAGGAGGVGSMVVQMARLKGARVLASAGSAERIEICRQLGAEAVVDRRREDAAAFLREEAPSGVDVYWETSREPGLEAIVAALAPRGRLVLMAGREARPAFPVGPFYVKDCTMVGFAMFNAPPEVQERCARDINRWVEQGALKARIGRSLPLSEAARAHRLQEENTLHGAGTLQGKIVLAPRDTPET